MCEELAQGLYTVTVSHEARTVVGHGGALVESKPCNRSVVGSNPALAAT